MRAFIVSLLLSSASAFVLPFAPRTAALSRIQMGVEDVAASCLEEGCPIDMVTELITELKGKKNNNVRTAAYPPEVTTRICAHSLWCETGLLACTSSAPTGL